MHLILDFHRLRDVSVGQRVQLLAKTMTASAVSFGFFLAVGSAIRCQPLQNSTQSGRRWVRPSHVEVLALQEPASADLE